MGITSIEWTDRTWNPVAGCTRVSAGCDNCYAARLAATRLKHMRQHEGLATITAGGRAAFNGTIRLLPERLEDPLHWRDPQRVFVNSMSDLFHEGVSDGYIHLVFAIMASVGALGLGHVFQILTKRPARMRDYMRQWSGSRTIITPEAARPAIPVPAFDVAWPPANVWLGVSAEDQQAWDERVELLGQVPAAVRFVSAEPLLGPIDCGNAFDPPVDGADYHPVDWVIVGGESGPGARPMHVPWALHLVQQCRLSDVPVFVKQLGELPAMVENDWREMIGPAPLLSAAKSRRPVVRDAGLVVLKLHDTKGGDPPEWPADLRVREFPQPRRPLLEFRSCEYDWTKNS